MPQPDDLIPPEDCPTLDSIVPLLHASAQQSDQTGDWPADAWAALRAAGAMRWVVPRRWGGDELPPLDLHLRYEKVAAASLAAALILTQRDSAADLIASSIGQCDANDPIAALLGDDRFVTVGIAQLTTSRQGGAPALRATPDGAAGYRIDGLIPWCSGAAKASAIVAGATLPDGRQLLFVLRTNAPGPTIDPPMPLVALRATWTAPLRCDGVTVGPADVLRGPAAQVLAPRRTHLPLGQAFLALGLCRGALELIERHTSAAAARAGERLCGQLARLRDEVITLSAPDRIAHAAASAPNVRGRCNDLALRATHAAVTLYKGTALLATHPAQRLAREAMFLLVWSCPNPVIDCTVDRLSDE